LSELIRFHDWILAGATAWNVRESYAGESGEVKREAGRNDSDENKGAEAARERTILGILLNAFYWRVR
jgi:hypothetical protein